MIKLKPLIMKPNLFKRRAILLGVPKKDDSTDLKLGIKADINYFKYFLTNNIGGAWNEKNEILTDTYTTMVRFKAILDETNKIKPDYLILFFSGHGCIYKDDIKQYIKLLDEMISISSLKNKLLCKKILIIIDACRTIIERKELLKEAKKIELIIPEKILKISKSVTRTSFNLRIIESDEGIITIYSSDFNEESFANYTGSNFIKILLDSSINWGESETFGHVLDIYNAFYRAKKLYKSIFDKQNPQITSNKRNKWFPFAIK